MLLQSISFQVLSILAPFLIYFLFFSLLSISVRQASSEQQLFRKGFYTDLAYWFLMPPLYGRLFQWLVVGLWLAYYGGEITGHINQRFDLGLFIELPLLIQVVLALLLRDVCQYWIHRTFHMQSQLWRFHAIHHSTTEMDWLSSARTHPIDGVALLVIVTAAVYLLGFSTQVFAILAVFSTVYNAMIHANVRWTFGPLKYIFVSPIFHRWHHTSPEEGGNRNFSPTFAFLDIIFGTYYMPEGQIPSRLGTTDPVPETFIKQVAWPFHRKTGR